MRAFTFEAPTTLADAFALLQAHVEDALPIAGGSDLMGLLKDDVVHYERLISLAGIAELRDCRLNRDGLHLGALVTLSELEHDARFQEPYRMLAEAARGVATPEIRHQGTLGGNLCQRPRCFHYRSALIPCLKKGGAVCPAIESPYQQYLSVMGGNGCFCVHASDLAPVLIAMGGRVRLEGPTGQRSMLLESFFAGPDQDVRRENVLAPGEVITAVTVPALAEDWRGAFLKARERTAGDFPLVSVATGFALRQGVIQGARVVMGGVAPVPWRSLAAEAVLEGQAPSEEVSEQAAASAFAAAQPLANNAYKVDIGRALVARAIQSAYAL
jgi:xanthine dehydrogenase YagS FAD-binding subunit